jgi:prefoldin subunit 5
MTETESSTLVLVGMVLFCALVIMWQQINFLKKDHKHLEEKIEKKDDKIRLLQDELRSIDRKLDRNQFR